MNIDGKKIFLYKNVSAISVYNFYMVATKNDFRYLIKGYNEEDENSYKKFKDSPKLEVIYENLYVEYIDTIKDVQIFNREKQKLRVEYMQQNYHIAVEILDLYKDTEEEAVLTLFENSLDFKFDLSKTIGPQLDACNRFLKLYKNKINVELAKYKSQYEKKIDDEDIDEISILANLDDQALNIERGLELGYHIDIKKTSLLRWINLRNQLQDKINAQNNGKG